MIQHKKLGVIFIDCYENHNHVRWHDRGVPHKNFYKNMLEVLKNYDIDSYVFHTTFLNLNWITQDIVRYFQQFVMTTANEQQRSMVIEEFIVHTGTEKLANELHELAGNPKSIFIPTLNGFTSWVHSSGISNWIVVGAHWGVCTHTKPLGFINLAELARVLPHLRIFSIPSCTIRTSNGLGDTVTLVDEHTQNSICRDFDYSVDYSLPWLKVDDDLWRINITCAT